MSCGRPHFLHRSFFVVGPLGGKRATGAGAAGGTGGPAELVRLARLVRCWAGGLVSLPWGPVGPGGLVGGTFSPPETVQKSLKKLIFYF